MQVRILRGRGLQVWLPGRKDHQPDSRLQLRGSMQVLPHLQLQGRLSAEIAPRISLSATGLQPDPGDARRSF
jgi:hypothetical protein